MTQEQAREIIQRLPSLYSLQTVEEEAILTLLIPKEFDIETDNQGTDREEDYVYCPNCEEFVYNEEDKFCRHCGQPFKER